MTLFAVYQDNTAGDMATYAKWLGQPAGMGSVHTGHASTSDYVGSVNYCLGADGFLGERMVSLPFLIDGTTLADAAAGKYDTYYTQAMQAILASTPPGLGAQSIIRVRQGEEQNSNWMSWSSPGNETAWIALWRHLWAKGSGLFRRMDTKGQLRSCWCPFLGQSDPGAPVYDPTLSWPGADAVDVVGMDVYQHPQWPSDPLQAFAFARDQKFGLTWQVGFAKANGCGLSLPEWAISADTMGPYLDAMFDFVAANFYDWITYWNSNAGVPSDAPCQLYGFPNAGAVYKKRVLAATTASVVAPVPVAPPAAPAAPTPVVAPQPAPATTVTVGVTMPGTLTLMFSANTIFTAGVPMTFSATTTPVVVNMSADEYQGDALVSVSIDGVMLYPSLDISAVHGKATQAVPLGSYPSGTYEAVFTFLNDAWGGSSATDRNAYVDSYQIGTAAPVTDEQTMMSNGSSYALKFTVP